MAEGAPAIGELIMFVGIMLLGLIVVFIFSTKILAPGLEIASAIEDASLAYSVASVVNILSTVDAGEVKMDFSKQFDIKSAVSAGSVYINIGDRSALIRGKLEAVSFAADKIKIVKLKGHDKVKILKGGSLK